MARPVKETPVLMGADALRFEKKVKENDSGRNKVSASDYARAQEAFKKVTIVK